MYATPDTPGAMLHETSPPAAAASTATLLDVPALPLHVAQRVFAYAIDSRWGRRTYVTEFLPHDYDKLVHHFRLRTGQRDELDALYRALEATGGHVRDLRICAGQYDWANQFVLERTLRSTAAVDALAVDWDRVFTACPNLLRLDVSRLPLNCSRQIALILNAASTRVPALQVLELSMPHNGAVDDATLTQMMQTLYTALERWFTLGTSGGLRQLTVPQRVHRGMPDLEAQNDAFLRAVASFCPRVAYLDGWQRTYFDDRSVFSTECWRSGPNAWTRFSAACTALREFNWVVAPLSESVLRTFAAHVKPALRKMTLVGGNAVYDVDDSGEDSDDDDATNSEPLFSHEALALVLRACPALEELHVLLSDATARARQLELCVDDALLYTLASACPKLKRLVIYEPQTARAQRSIAGVTDAGLNALARMPALEHIAIKQTQSSARGLLALVLLAPESQHKRRVVVNVGTTVQPFMSFFTELLALLALLADEPPARLCARRFELKLHVCNSATRLRDPHATRLEIEALVQRVMQQHVDVAIHFRAKYEAYKGVLPDLRTLESVVIVSPRTMAASDSSDFDTEWTDSSR